MCHDACLFRQPWFRSPVGVCVGSLPTVYSTPPRPSSTSVSSVQDMPPDYPVNLRGEAGLAPPAPTADYPVQQSSTSVSEGEKLIKTFFFSPGVSTAAAVLSSTIHRHLSKLSFVLRRGRATVPKPLFASAFCVLRIGHLCWIRCCQLVCRTSSLCDVSFSRHSVHLTSAPPREPAFSEPASSCLGP